MGTGDPDTYKAFCWRFWNLIREDGYNGVVLPRSAFLSAGSEEFRRKILNEAKLTDLTFLKNKRGWVFDEAEHRYTIALFAFTRSTPTQDQKIPLRGPYPDAESYNKGLERGPHFFPVEQAKKWTDTAAFPLLPDDPRSVSVFDQLTTSPRLGDETAGTWHARPNTELHATNDKQTDSGETLMHFVDDPPNEYWPIYKGNSFTHWDPDTGVRYAWAESGTILDYLQDSRENSYQYAGSRSAFAEFSQEWIDDPDTLPCLSPRIAFRNVTRATDTRTMICSLVPPKVLLTNAAPYFLWPDGDERDEAYLLGILSSIPLDWYARRFVEANMNYHILNAFPIPRVKEDNSLKQRTIELAGRLAAVDSRYENWADKIGVEHGAIDDKQRQNMIYELDAVVGILYGLSKEQMRVVFETFHSGWEYEERLNKVMQYYNKWK
jgi:hypothetical protein